MNDITKCADIKCPSKDKCYRYTAKPGRFQSYADFNREPGDGDCESFWPTEKDNAQST